LRQSHLETLHPQLVRAYLRCLDMKASRRDREYFCFNSGLKGRLAWQRIGKIKDSTPRHVGLRQAVAFAQRATRAKSFGLIKINPINKRSGDDDDQGLMKSAAIASTIGSIPRPMMTPTVQAASLSSSGLNRLRMAKPSSQQSNQYDLGSCTS
jgi:hypothetical protein